MKWIRTLRTMVGAAAGAGALGFGCWFARRRWAEVLLDHRIAVLVGVAVSTCAVAAGLQWVRFDASQEMWFRDGDPELSTYHAFVDRFGSDEMVVLGVEAPEGRDVFEAEVLEIVDAITATAETAPWVATVQSLTNVEVYRSVEEGLEIVPLVPGIPRSEGESASIRDAALGDAGVNGQLVSPDGRLALVAVGLTPAGGGLEGKTALIPVLRRIALEAEDRGVRVHLSGTPLFDEAVYHYSKADILFCVPLMVGCILVATLIVYRSPRISILALSVVTLTLVWTLGMMGWAEVELNVVSSTLFGLVLCVGVADSLHILADIEQGRASGLGTREAIIHALEALFGPCFFTTATTAAGLLAFTGSGLAPVRELGISAAFGVTMALVLSLTFLPAVVSLLPAPSHALLERERSGALTRLLNMLARPGLRMSRRIAAISVPVILVGTAAAAQVEISMNPLHFFPAEDPLRIATTAIDERLGGTTTLELVARTPERGLDEPETLARLAELQEWIEAQPGTGKVFSIVDHLQGLNQALTGDPSASLPATSNAAAQLHLLMEGDASEALIQDERSIARISARIRMSETEAVRGWQDELLAKIETEVAGEELEVQVTGFARLMSAMEHHLVWSQIESFAIALTVITLMLMGVFRSVRLGVLSLIPNLMPVVAGLATLWLIDLPLDPGTVMIASLALGICVDDTVHFLARYRRARAAGSDVEDAIEAAIRDAGRAIIVTSVVLASCFVVLGAAYFAPVRNFGLILAFVVTLACVADLKVLPAVLMVTEPSRPVGDATT